MTLWPSTARLGIGVASPTAQVQVLGTEITQAPGAGYLILGTNDMLHMQLDRNELRVAGPTPETVGNLYLQRFGGSISIRSSSEDLASRVVFPATGGLALGASDPNAFAVDAGFQRASWPKPNAALAVDGHVYSRMYFGDEGRFAKRLRVGSRGDDVPGGAYDELHKDAVAMIGGKLTAHSIVVHIHHWADDVFDEDYELRSLAETKAFIEEHRHLPDVPAEPEVVRGGVDLAEMNAVLLRKVEELTLHAIAQQERIEALEAKRDACD